MDSENKRVNIDSAKKLAVMQRKAIIIQIWIIKALDRWYLELISSLPNLRNFLILAKDNKLMC